MSGVLRNLRRQRIDEWLKIGTIPNFVQIDDLVYTFKELTFEVDCGYYFIMHEVDEDGENILTVAVEKGRTIIDDGVTYIGL